MDAEVKILPIEITDEERKEYDEKCIELQLKYNCPKVHCSIQINFDSNNKRVASYFRHPDFDAQLALMSKLREDNMYEIANELRLLYQLQEESDPLTYGDSFASEPYKLGLAKYCLGIITIVQDSFKKK